MSRACSQKLGIHSITDTPIGKRPLGRPRRTSSWEDDIRTDLKETATIRGIGFI